MRVRRTVEVAATPGDLYDLLTNAGRLKDWVTIHDGLLDTPQGALVEGSELTQRLNLAGRRFTVRWTVVEAERPHRVVWSGRGPLGSTAGVTYELQRGDEGTQFTYTNEYALPGGPLGKLAEPVLSKVASGEIDASLAQLRTLFA